MGTRPVRATAKRGGAARLGPAHAEPNARTGRLAGRLRSAAPHGSWAGKETAKDARRHDALGCSRRGHIGRDVSVGDRAAPFGARAVAVRHGRSRRPSSGALAPGDGRAPPRVRRIAHGTRPFYGAHRAVGRAGAMPMSRQRRCGSHARRTIRAMPCLQSRLCLRLCRIFEQKRCRSGRNSPRGHLPAWAIANTLRVSPGAHAAPAPMLKRAKRGVRGSLPGAEPSALRSPMRARACWSGGAGMGASGHEARGTAR